MFSHSIYLIYYRQTGIDSAFLFTLEWVGCRAASGRGIVAQTNAEYTKRTLH